VANGEGLIDLIIFRKKRSAAIKRVWTSCRQRNYGIGVFLCIT